MKRQLMAEEWDEFARRVLPEHTSSIQRQEMRRAFYAGAQGILYGIIAAFAHESEVTDADLEIMANLEVELSEFAELINKGRA